MNLKSVNHFFGNALFVVGASKLILLIIIFFQMFTNVNSVLNGREIDYTLSSNLSAVLAIAQIVLAIICIIMIVVNTSAQSETISGYFLGLVAFSINFLSFSFIINLFLIFSQSSLYMKAGKKVLENNETTIVTQRPSRKLLKSTNWFYASESDSNKKIEKAKKLEMKKQMKIEKLEQEIIEWKELLDSGEIDENIYNDEIARLNKKIEELK